MAAPVPDEPEVFVFGPFALDAFARTLTAHGRPVALQPKTFELLAHLVRNPGRRLTKDELIDALWPGAEIGEGNLSQQIFLLRAILARCAPRATYIVTEPGRGYRFVEHVATRDAFAAAPSGGEPNRLYARGRYFYENYDAARKVWHQTWVDNSGGILYLDGGLKNGSMVLGGKRRARKGGWVTDRITYTPRPDGSVRQWWQVSRDGGASWKTVFDGIYRKAN
jgi:DNA-binding winged helix-turn-helix (wHTH) protein